MKKNKFKKDWFPHDFYSRVDSKILGIRMDLGMEGLGVYWSLVEIIYEGGGYLKKSELPRTIFELRCSEEIVIKVIEDFDLFQFDEEKIWSITALERIEKRQEISEKAKESINRRWSKTKKDTNVIRSNNGPNTTTLHDNVMEPYVSNDDDEYLKTR